ncbi:MAG: hypothetical protein HZC26_02230, partial [Candidatus Magasanikbacteria bacterium]|nr:hypothetical protein [Candidatus Magasanikbacteria bacterium]
MYFFLKHKLIFITLVVLVLNLIFGSAPASADLTEKVMGQVNAGAKTAQFSEAIDPRLAVM